MKILFITPRLPYPPIKGDKLRAYNFIKCLSQNYTIDLCSFIENPREQEYVKELRNYCRSINIIQLSKSKSYINAIFGLFNKLPLQVNYYFSRKMQQKINYLLKKEGYDLIQVVLLRMMPYVSKVTDAPIILDHIDALSLNMHRRGESEKSFFKKLIFKLEKMRVAIYEKQASKIYRDAIITSQVDKDAIGDNNITVIPNGVDTKYFKPDAYAQKDIDLLFTGNMEYFPNINAVEYFFKRIHPLIVKTSNNIKIYIVGPNPPAWLKNLNNNKDIFITGFVDDLREYYNRAKVFIAPLQAGSGIQNKILEAMAMGLPVITTSYGNSGILARHNEEIIITDDLKTILTNIIDLLNNHQKSTYLSNNARRLVEEKFSWNNSTKLLENIYSKFAKG